ncbi:hypothetical protein LOD99_9195 [Oopsacas minuta]|uniref:Uncharacterized protein n=1 Tax=Oopsacas minuta TaxID=111878 RepID=A0AAV7JE20_9METZ|nr:hypothetical protein LOD99_9195 [Oopsacas minuta]
MQETRTESEYSSDPDHDSVLSSEDITLSDLATNTALKNVNLNETFNISENQLEEQTGTKDITNGTKCETDVTNENAEFKPGETFKLELEPTEMKSLPNQEKLTPTQELEYLKLKRAITQECVKYNIFTPGGVKRLCQNKTRDRTDLEEERVSELIAQILRELDY